MYSSFGTESWVEPASKKKMPEERDTLKKELLSKNETQRGKLAKFSAFPSSEKPEKADSIENPKDVTRTALLKRSDVWLQIQSTILANMTASPVTL